MKKTELEALRELLESLPPGAWTTGEGSHWGREVRCRDEGAVVFCSWADDDAAAKVASGIAAMRNVLPNLARVLEAAMAFRDHGRRVAADPMQAWARSPIDELLAALEPFG
jgi:hypothetical protein